MQKVELYCDVLAAKRNMEQWIKSGWRVHTCSMTSCLVGYSPRERILVVYEHE